MPQAPDDRFLEPAPTPAYFEPEVRQSLAGRARSALEQLKECRACPRNCGPNRLGEETGYCRIGRYARVSSVFPHHGEESCLTGRNGSGTIFFSMCNMRCVFCQNWEISQRFGGGRETDAVSLADAMLQLQELGCHNVNLVSPEHVVPQVVEALVIAIEGGLRLPVVYNTNAYDSAWSLRMLDGLVDIYMPDLKMWSHNNSARLLDAEDYPDRAREAVLEMHRQVGDLKFDGRGIACRGLLVRHLVMPGQTDESGRIVRWLAEQVSRDTFVNIMGQYRPANRVGSPSDPLSPASAVAFEEINRRPTAAEMEKVYEVARQAGLWRFDR